MKDKQRRILEGQVIAACNILREVQQELCQGSNDLPYKEAYKACEEVRKLLRAIGEYEVVTKKKKATLLLDSDKDVYVDFVE